MENFSAAWFDVTAEWLTDSQRQYWHERLLRSAKATELEVLAELLTGESLRQFQRVLASSLFASTQLCEHPEWLVEFLQFELATPLNKEHLQHQLKTGIQSSAADWEVWLRRWRNRQMTRLIWRDFNRLSNTQQTTSDLTLITELVLQACLEHLYQQQCREMGEPQDAQKNSQPMLILGMGKLGASELNLSSDID